MSIEGLFLGLGSRRSMRPSDSGRRCSLTSADLRASGFTAASYLFFFARRHIRAAAVCRVGECTGNLIEPLIVLMCSHRSDLQEKN